jgi:hypothetical protein
VRYLRVVLRRRDGLVARKGMMFKIDFPAMRRGGGEVARR